MTQRTFARSRLAAFAGAAALAAAVVASGTVVAVGGGAHAAASTISITSPATGGSSIKSSTARIGGTGAWTQLTGPKLREGSIGALDAGSKLSLALPPNFEFNTTRKTAPTVSGCDKKASSISYPSLGVASITIQMKSGAVQGSVCTIDFGKILQVRPVSSDPAAGTGGNIVASVVMADSPMPLVVPGNAGTIKMTVIAPPPSSPSIAPATGGSAIPSTTARVGGSGAWTQLTGPVIQETAIDQIKAGTAITLSLPANFEWNTANVNPPVVTNCDRTAAVTAYLSATALSVTLQMKAGATVMANCRIDFASLLQVRPVNASATGSAGDIAAALVNPATPTPGVIPGSAGYLAMVTATPPPVTLSLAATSPYLNNNAIDWGQYIDLTTTATAGTAFQLQVTTDNVNWETLKDSVGNVLTFTTAADGKYTYRYTPVRNYWYRAVAGASMSNSPRVTVRQTIAIRPQNSGTKQVSAGTKVTFNATVRPVRPELAKANVLFQLYKKSGSSWVLSKSATLVINDDGVASWTVTFSSGSWYVRAQAQPTPVNANSFWSPNQYYTAD